MSSFDVGDTVRCINHPFLKDMVGTVLYTNEHFAKIEYTSQYTSLEKVIVLAINRLIKHTPPESPLIQKIRELEYRFKNKNSPNPYAPTRGDDYDVNEEDEDEDNPYDDPDGIPAPSW